MPSLNMVSVGMVLLFWQFPLRKGKANHPWDNFSSYFYGFGEEKRFKE